MNAVSSYKIWAAVVCLIAMAELPVRAQEAPVAATPVAKNPELLRLDQQYKSEVLAKVDEPLKAGKQRLDTSYAAAVDGAFKKATVQGQLDDAVALQHEAKTFTETSTVPEKDDEGTRPDVAKLRSSYRAEASRLEAQRLASLRLTTESHIGRLRVVEKELTKAQKIDEAVEVRNQIVALSPQIVLPLAATPAPPVVSVKSATPASAKGSIKPTLQIAAEAAKNPVGTWIFKVTGGPAYRRTFHEDGTITGEGFPGAGKWRVSGNKIIISYPQGDGFMSLPLKPTGTKAYGHSGQEQTATKVEE